MKTPFKLLTQLRNLALLGVIAAFSLSCSEDDTPTPVPAAPMVTASQTSLSGTPGSVVTTTLNAEGAGGLTQITVRRNGVPDPSFPNISFTGGPNTGTSTFTYTIPASFSEGDQVIFLFNAVDALGQTSSDVAVTITASDFPLKQIVEVEGTITADTEWTADKIYLLKGFVRVGTDLDITQIPAKDSGPTLTIEEGTVIYGDRETKGTLIIQRGAKIIANGTATNPIVFTSERAIGTKEPGDWGGVVICGRASNNQANGIFELEGGYGGYSGGGTTPDDDDDSGSLTYVRIEYAGVPINPNQEVNTLTMGSVGRATVIEHVQATYGLDDSFEWFGGTVNGKYLVS